MKKSRIIAAAMASIALTGALVSCGKDEGEEFSSENNANYCVYGPPPASFESDMEEQYGAKDEINVSSLWDEEQDASQGD